MELGFNCETMIYRQPGTGAKGSNYYYWQSFEFMFVWVKNGQPRVSNRIADVPNTRYGMARPKNNMSKIHGMRTEREGKIGKKWSVRPNVWTIPNKGNGTEHPAVFPPALARDHILTWSNPGDLVFDPMCGSGTTGGEAVKLGRFFHGCELDEGYAEIARSYVEAASIQKSLFNE